jgi:Raf kinase inhibitor-like YbhB/YbcL family protein
MDTRRLYRRGRAYLYRRGRDRWRGHDRWPGHGRWPGRSYWQRRGRWRTARRALAAALSGMLLALPSGCGLVGTGVTFQGDAPDVITVTTPVLSRGAIPALYTCHGAGLSPPLHWSGAPARTKALALVVDDSGTPITPYIYWIVFDINPVTTDLQSGQLPPGARQADNSTGHAAYDPPCPRNNLHGYRFTVYALRSVLSLPNGVALKPAWMAIAQAAIARGRLTANANP